MIELCNPWVRDCIRISEKFLLSRKLVSKYRVMAVLWLIFGIQGICGIILMILDKQFTLAEILTRILYFIISSVTLVIIFAHHYDRQRVEDCLKNVSFALNCSSWAEEAMEWKKHQKEFELFIFGFTLNLFMAAILTTVVSPVVRIEFMTGATFVIFPTWYPVDVFTHRWMFWAAYACELMIMLYLATMYSGYTVLFVYVVVTTNVKLNVLKNYLKMFASQQTQIESCTMNQMNKCTDDPVRKTAKDISSDHLRIGIEDLQIIRRQMERVNKAFTKYITLLHSVSTVANVISTFAVFYELRTSRKLTINVVQFISYAFASILSLFTACYLATMLQETYKSLLQSLWESDWYTGKSEFKKLFLLLEMTLNQSPKLKAYTFHPINLHTFIMSVYRSWSVITFLNQVSAKK